MGRPVAQAEANSMERLVSFVLPGAVGRLLGYEPWQHDVGTAYR